MDRSLRPSSGAPIHNAHLIAAALAVGLGLAVLVRPDALTGLICAGALLGLAWIQPEARVVLLAAGLGITGLTWGGVRIDSLDHSDLAGRVGEVGRVVVEVTSPVRTGSTRLRMFVRVVELEGVPLSEPAQLEAPLSLGRPRRGDVLEATCSRRSSASRCPRHRAGRTVVVRSTRPPTSRATVFRSCSKHPGSRSRAPGVVSRARAIA